MISFSKFSDVLSASTYARPIGNLGNICFGVNILIPLPFSSLLKSIIFSAILTILFWFSFSGLSFLKTVFLNQSINQLINIIH